MRTAKAIQAITALSATILALASSLAPALAESADLNAPWERVKVVERAEDNHDSTSEISVEYNGISKVIVYITSFCSECDKVTEFLKANSISFQEQFVLPGTNLLGLFGTTQTPATKFIYRDGSSRKIIGFDEKLLRAIIEPKTGLGTTDSFEISDFELTD